MTATAMPAETAAFLASSGIPHTLPDAPDFAAAHDTFSLPRSGSGPYAPAAVARPRNVADVEALVTHCAATGTTFSVRGGGHDMFRRSILAGLLNIDLRSFDQVEVAADRQTAKVGGGALAGKVLAVLEPLGLTTPVGNCSSVGYAGWAMLGGYGPEGRIFGLGVDQIVAARVVGPDGKARDVDGGDVLRGIKGAGGNFGIVVEVTIRVYPMAGEILATTVVYQPTTNGTPSIVAVLREVEKLFSGPAGSFPDKLFLVPQAFCSPNGSLPMCSVVWHGSAADAAEQAEARAWTARVAAWAALATPAPPDPQPTTVGKIALATTAALPKNVTGGSGTASATGLTPAVLELVTGALSAFPSAQGNAGGMFFHLLPPGSPSSCLVGENDKEVALRRASVWPNRMPHVMMELLPLGLTAEAAEAGELWAAEWSRRITESDGGLAAQYVTLTAPGQFDLERAYGSDEAAWLRRARAEVDPQGLFANAIPKLV